VAFASRELLPAQGSVFSLEESMYAIIRTGGKQYQVAEGDRLRVEKLTGEVGDTVELSDVLMVSDGEAVKVGQPVVEGAKVIAKIVEQDKGKKIIVFKKKRRQGYSLKQGHRQFFTSLEIQGISA
jgi:large subunit ribosomal protein L21